MTSILPISTTANLCAIATSPAYSQRMSYEDKVIPAPVARSANLELAKQIQGGKSSKTQDLLKSAKLAFFTHFYASRTHTTMMLRRD